MLIPIDPKGPHTNIAIIPIVYIISPYFIYVGSPSLMASAKKIPLIVAYTVALGNQAIAKNILSL
jgi:hypothetical protein